MFDAFTDDNDPRFVKFVLPLARLHFERDVRSGALKLGLGVVAALAIAAYYGPSDVNAMAFCFILPVFLLLATLNRSHRPTVRLNNRDYPQKLNGQERALIRKAILTNPPRAHHLTPYIETLRRKAYLLLVVRLLVVVGLVAAMVIVFWYF